MTVSIEFFPEKQLAAKKLRATTTMLRLAEPVDPMTATFFVLAAVCIAAGIAANVPRPAPVDPAALLGEAATPKAESQASVNALNWTDAEIGMLAWADDPEELFKRTIRFKSAEIRAGRVKGQVAVPGPDGLWMPIDVRPGDAIAGTDFVVERVDLQLILLRDGDGGRHRLFYPPDWPAVAKRYGFSGRNPVSNATIRLAESPMWTLASGSRRVYGVRMVNASNGQEISDATFQRMIDLLERFAIEFQSRVAVNPDLDPANELRLFLHRNRNMLVRLVAD